MDNTGLAEIYLDSQFLNPVAVAVRDEVEPTESSCAGSVEDGVRVVPLDGFGVRLATCEEQSCIARCGGGLASLISMMWLRKVCS